MLPEGGCVADLLGAISGLLILAGFCFYIAGTLKGNIRPNPASWAMWLSLGALATPDYIAAAASPELGWIRAVFGILDVVMCFVVLSLVFIMHNLAFILHKHIKPFPRIRRLGVLCMVSCAGSVLALWHFRVPADHILSQAPVLLAFLPILVSTWISPANEDPLPWLLWVGAFSVDLIALRIAHVPNLTFLGCVTGIVLQGAVAELAFRKRSAIHK